MLRNSSYSMSPTKKNPMNEQSPSRAKINILAEKLTNIRIDDEKSQKKDFFEQRVKNIHDKMTKSYQNDEARIKMLKESITKLGEDFYTEKAARELFESKKEKGLKNLEGSQASLVCEDGKIILDFGYRFIIYIV